jgi:enoyl reductase-like protein
MSVAQGNLHDLELAFEGKQREYEDNVSKALKKTTKSEIETTMVDVMKTKQEMLDILHQEMALVTSEPSGLEAKRKEIIERMNKFQEEYADMVASEDKLETLRRIHSRESIKVDGAINTYTIVFGVACLVLLGFLIRPST